MAFVILVLKFCDKSVCQRNALLILSKHFPLVLDPISNVIHRASGEQLYKVPDVNYINVCYHKLWCRLFST